MTRFLVSRLGQSIIVLYVITTVVFLMMKAVPGGPFSQERNASSHITQKLEEQYGLNDSLSKQYLRYIWNITPKKLNPVELTRFDFENGLGINFGYSFRYEGRSVNELIKKSFPVSLELGFYSLLVACILGISIGSIAALKPNSLIDYIPMGFATSSICIPTFVMGPILILLFGFFLPEPFRLPIMFWESPTENGLFSSLSHKILPTLTLGFYYAASIARLTRGSMLEVMKQDYIRTARAKGLSELQVVTKHGLRSGLIPVVSYLGPVAAHLITGSFVVEYLFMLPGLGRHLINAALNRDYTLIMGTVLLYAALLIVLNLLVDLIVAALNPKVKFAND